MEKFVECLRSEPIFPTHFRALLFAIRTFVPSDPAGDLSRQASHSTSLIETATKETSWAKRGSQAASLQGAVNMIVVSISEDGLLGVK